VRFDIVTAASKKMAVFWVVAACSQMEVPATSFIEATMEAASASETSENF
jgi:hypothetical protein